MSERRSDQRAQPDAPDDSALPEVSGDERDEGWGEDARNGRRDEEWYRRERPPHHD